MLRETIDIMRPLGVVRNALIQVIRITSRYSIINTSAYQISFESHITLLDYGCIFDVTLQPIGSHWTRISVVGRLRMGFDILHIPRNRWNTIFRSMINLLQIINPQHIKFYGSY